MVHMQGKRAGQRLLVLQTAGVELGPELHLQHAIVLLGELKFCHTALELNTHTKAHTVITQIRMVQ